MTSVESAVVRPHEESSLRDITPDQRRAFIAAFLGWVVDSFDFTMLTFVLIDIQRSFTVDRALAGALGTATLSMRLIGGIAAGTAADRWGRRRPLMWSILWFSVVSGLSGLSTSYGMLFGLRALFGIGMGGQWAAGMPLALEHWPAHLRGIASGVLAGGWYWGFILAALVFQLVYPTLSDRPDIAWRVMMFAGVVPGLFVVWYCRGVRESPVWLQRQQDLGKTGSHGSTSLRRIFQRDLRGVTLQTSILVAVIVSCYYSIAYWYPTFLRDSHLPPLRYLLALNLGGILGTAFCGRFSETRFGRRGAATIAALAGVAVIPAYLLTADPILLWFGALVMGATGASIWGIVPSYTTERFPTSVRGIGAGFAYHAGTFLGSGTPLLVGALQDRGMSVAGAMSTCIAVFGILVAGVVWLGPETRGAGSQVVIAECPASLPDGA